MAKCAVDTEYMINVINEGINRYKALLDSAKSSKSNNAYFIYLGKINLLRSFKAYLEGHKRLII